MASAPNATTSAAAPAAASDTADTPSASASPKQLSAAATVADMAAALAEDPSPAIDGRKPSEKAGLVIGKKAVLVATQSYQVDPMSNVAFEPGVMKRAEVTPWVIAQFDKEPPLLGLPPEDE